MNQDHIAPDEDLITTAPAPAKKTYECPQLTVHGDVTDITKGAEAGNPDGLGGNGSGTFP